MDIDDKGKGELKDSASADSSTSDTDSAETNSADTAADDTVAADPLWKPLRGGRDFGGEMVRCRYERRR